jgi:broad specificity phosphatase PhoE
MINLSDINNDSRNIALIRHTERYEIPDGELGNDVNVTPNGIKMANNFGKLLKNKNLIKIFTSPVKRCVHTAERIVEGYGQNIDIYASSMLGNPSAYIKDSKIAFERMNETSFINGYLDLINGKGRPGFYSLQEGSERLDNFLKETSSENGITLYISHDIIILYYIFFKTKKVYSKENWLDFLDGIKLAF